MVLFFDALGQLTLLSVVQSGRNVYTKATKIKLPFKRKACKVLEGTLSALFCNCAETCHKRTVCVMQQMIDIFLFYN